MRVRVNLSISYCLFKLFMAMGMNDFLCMFFLEGLYIQRDGRSWKSFCRGWMGSCVKRLAFLLTAWVWSTLTAPDELAVALHG